MKWLFVPMLAAVCLPTPAQQAPRFVTDPQSDTLQALAAPGEFDMAQYGCGPLEEPGRTYYVSLDGDDEADGLSRDTAWRHVAHGVARLEAGDTLVIAEGEYIEPTITMNVDRQQSGEPGRPITVRSAPRHRVIISGGVQPALSPAAGTSFCHRAEVVLPDGEAAIWESDTQILLQRTGSLQMADELPGTWWYDEKAQVLYVHFSDSRGPDVHGVSVRPGGGSTSNFRSRDERGLDIRASYVRLSGLHLRNYHTALLISGNRMETEGEDREYRGGDHITVEDCSFSSTTFAGVVLWEGARWNLLRDCYGTLNGARGSMLVNHRDAHDNLFMGNRFHSSAPTIREGGWRYHFGVSTYGHVGRRNHIINNLMHDVQSFRSKYMFLETVVQGNVMTGRASTVPCSYPGWRPFELWEEPRDRVIFRNNVFLAGFATASQPMPEGSGPGDTWCDRYKCFVNNFVPGAERARTVEDARFADPAWLDYRLQSDSPLQGAGLGGYDIGVPSGGGRIFYVSCGGANLPPGDDANPGTSLSRPFATLSRAAAELRPGDTLYVLPGEWPEPLVVAASGTEDDPITIRGHGRREVVLPGIAVAGDRVVIEGLTVKAAADDGITVGGEVVSIRECVVTGRGEAGIAARGAPELSVERCTIAWNARGVVLEAGSTDARIRDCIIAANESGAAVVSEDSAGGYLGSSNCYDGDALDAARIAAEIGSIVGAPNFMAGDTGDLRLRWDSPAAHLAPFGRPAGARPAVHRTPEIENVQVASVSSDTAIVTWRTPRDDSTGSVSYREEGAEDWTRADRDTPGTVHGVGLTELEPGTTYQFSVRADSRRGGSATGEVLTFTTTEQPRPPATFYVAEDGDDGADGRSREQAWRTLRRASFAVMPGDTVVVTPGVYHSAIAPLCGGTADRRIVFRHEGDDPAVIDGLGVVAPLVDLSRRPHVTVEGLIFDRLPAEGHPGVIRAEMSDGFELLNCRIGWTRRHGGFGNGVYLYRCNGARVEGNVIWGTRYHVVLNQSPGTLVKNNTVSWGQVFAFQITGPHDGVRLVNNIFYHPTSVPNAAVAIAWPDERISLHSDHNCWGPMRDGTRVAYVYHSSVNDVGPTGPTLAAWQEDSGLDAHSIQADPMFVDPEAGDFQLSPGSPAIGAGEGGVDMGALDEMILRSGREGP